MYQCRRCDIYYVDADEDTSPAQEKLFYSTIDENSHKAYFEPFRRGQYRHVLERLGPADHRTLLDVGAAYGWMLQVGLNLGFDSFGLEPGDAPYDSSLEGRIFRASLEEYSRQTDQKFDVITTWHVVEHLTDPATAIGQMRDLLTDQGVLVIAVPTSDGRFFRLALLLKRLFGTRRLLHELFYVHNPNMHFFYPNEKSLRVLLEASGLQVQWTETLEAFDWTTLWRRGGSRLSRFLLKVGGPFLKWSKFTAAENLVIVAGKTPASAKLSGASTPRVS